MGDAVARAFNVLIIGAGKIGAFFDHPGDDEVLTHAHAFSKHTGFNLLGFVDADQEQARQAASVWGGEAFGNLDEALQRCQVDVVSLAVPDDYHYSYLRELSHSDIKLLFAEKPLTKTLPEALEINELYSTLPIVMEVNYSRRFVPEMIELRHNIRSGAYGRFISGTGYYGKGLFHNGSHMLDLMLSFIGNFTDYQVIGANCDCYEDDPSVSAILTTKEGAFFSLQTVDCRAYTLFEMDLLFENRRLRLVNSGFVVQEYEIRENTLFAGYRNPVMISERGTALRSAIYYAAENIYQHLSKGEALLCTLEEGLNVLRLCQDLKESVKK